MQVKKQKYIMSSKVSELWMDLYRKVRESSAIIVLAYLYLVLPILIFLIGWCRPIVSIPVSIVIVFSLIGAIANTPSEWKFQWSRDNVIKLILALVLIFIWVLLAGIGQVSFQNDDQPIRNGLYEMLVRNSWPITKEISIDGIKQSRTLVYYIGFWLPSAVWGKTFGLSAGYVFQMVWAVLGIFTVYYLICAEKKKIILWPLFIMIFFSGLDAMAEALITPDNKLDFIWSLEHLERWPGIYQYSSMTTQLFWVFNQAIPCWVAVMLLSIQKNCRNLVFIISTVMLSATFPFIGMIPITIYYMFSKLEHKNLQDIKCKESRMKTIIAAIRQFVKEIATLQNVIGGGCIGLLCFSYLKLNVAGGVQGVMLGRSVSEQLRGQSAIPYFASIGTTEELLAIGASVRPMWGTVILLYLLFIFLEFGIYMIFLYKREKNNFLYYLVFVMLCIIPFIKVGMSIDFCMRASLPALFIIMLMIIDYIEESKKNYAFYLLIGVFIIGAITPMHEIRRSISKTINQGYFNEVVDEEGILSAGNFSGIVDYSVFGKYIIKK